jgi:hypothetical protein
MTDTRDPLEMAVDRAVRAERERCAGIAEARAAYDKERYKAESDWRQPYAYNRVIRASLDIAAAIRGDE